MKQVLVPALLSCLVIAGSTQTAVPATAAGQQPAGSGSAPQGRGGSMNPVPQEMLLWEAGAPGALGDTDADRPMLTFHRAARGATGTAVV